VLETVSATEQESEGYTEDAVYEPPPSRDLNNKHNIYTMCVQGVRKNTGIHVQVVLETVSATE